MKKLIVILLSLVSSNVNAYDRGDKLMWACKAEPTSIENIIQKSHCIGYIQGIVEGLQLGYGLHPETREICFPPSGMSGDQQIQIVTKYMEAHPEELHLTARSTVMIAFQHAFPCK